MFYNIKGGVVTMHCSVPNSVSFSCLDLVMLFILERSGVFHES